MVQVYMIVSLLVIIVFLSVVGYVVLDSTMTWLDNRNQVRTHQLELEAMIHETAVRELEEKNRELELQIEQDWDRTFKSRLREKR